MPETGFACAVDQVHPDAHFGGGGGWNGLETEWESCPGTVYEAAVWALSHSLGGLGGGHLGSLDLQSGPVSTGGMQSPPPPPRVQRTILSLKNTVRTGVFTPFGERQHCEAAGTHPR